MISALLPRRWMRLAFAACASAAFLPAFAQTAWLIGEQHDQTDQQRQAALLVQGLAVQGRLQGLVLEMAERGGDTRALAADATEEQVRAALRWSERDWPWARYRELVMTAVRAGSPVVGGNLPRAELRPVMQQAEWDGKVPPAARRVLLDAVREGHCGLVPDAHLGPMVRIQVARDRSLAETVAAVASAQALPVRGEAVVVLQAGAMHASRAAGVPVHLAQLAPNLPVRTIRFATDPAHLPQVATTGFDEVRQARPEPPRDHCAELRARGMPRVNHGPDGPSSPPAGRPASSPTGAASAASAPPAINTPR